MKFHAKLDTEENRAWWRAVHEGALAWDALPEWKKGILKGV
jgi:hypothetical protein